MRQLIHSVSGDNDLVPFLLWWIQATLRGEKISKIFVRDCSIKPNCISRIISTCYRLLNFSANYSQNLVSQFHPRLFSFLWYNFFSHIAVDNSDKFPLFLGITFSPMIRSVIKLVPFDFAISDTYPNGPRALSFFISVIDSLAIDLRARCTGHYWPFYLFYWLFFCIFTSKRVLFSLRINRYWNSFM